MANRTTAQKSLFAEPEGPKVPSLVVRPRSQLSPGERALLQRSELPTDICTEAWTPTGSSKQLGYSTHGVFRFFGKFPPTLAAHLIGRYTMEGDWVLDPMAGSGTTAVEAVLSHRHVVTRDVSPLSILLTTVKTTHLPEYLGLAGLGRVRQRYTSNTPSSWRPIGLRNPDHWFLPATTKSLSRIYAAIEAEEPGATKNLLLASFAATVRRVSRATTQQGRLFLDVETAIADAWAQFEKKSLQAIEAASTFAPPTTTVRVERRSALEVPSRAHHPFHLLIAHPPYFNNYKYSGINSLELAWLGHDHNAIRKQEIRESFKVGKPEKVEAYLEDMARTMAHFATETAKGGRVAVMIGDTVLKDEYIPVTRMLLDRIRPLPMTLELIALRVPQFTEASWVASQRRKSDKIGVTLNDFVLVFRKDAVP